MMDPATTVPPSSNPINSSPKPQDKAQKPKVAINLEEAQDCKNLVSKLNQEKKERERRRLEQMRQEQEKLNRELEERQRKIEEERAQLMAEKDRRREEIEKKIRDRIEQRQISQQRMVEETKKISKKPKLFVEIEKKYTDEQIREVERQRVEKLKEIKAQHQPVSKDEIVSHARKYEDIIRQKREELRQKRGILDSVNSNPNIIGNIP